MILVKGKREEKRILRGKAGYSEKSVKETRYKGFEADSLKSIRTESGKVMVEVRKPPERQSGQRTEEEGGT